MNTMLNLKNRKSKKGQSLVLIALASTVLLGFAALAVDYSLMVLEATNMQKAADAAALAGAAKLSLSKDSSGAIVASDASKANARTDAVFVASQNGYTITTSNVSFPTAARVRVDVTTNSTLFLSRVFNATSATITRHATAECSSVKTINGIAPLGVTTTDYAKYGPNGTNKGQQFMVNLVVNQDDPFAAGNALALSTDSTPSKSISEFGNLLSSIQFESTATVGAALNSLNGTTSAQNAAQDALNSRLASGNTTFPIVIIPPKDQTNGTSYFVGDMAFVEVSRVQNPQGGNGANSSGIRITLKFVPATGSTLDPYQIQLAGAGETGSTITILRLIDDL